MAILGLKVDDLRIEKWQDVLFPVRFEQATSWLLPSRNFCSQMYLHFAKLVWIFVGTTWNDEIFSKRLWYYKQEWFSNLIYLQLWVVCSNSLFPLESWSHNCFSHIEDYQYSRCPLHSFLHLLCIDLCWSNKTLFVHVCHCKGKAFYNNLYPQENHFRNCSFHKSGHKYNVHQFDSCPGRVHISLWSSNNWQHFPLCPHSLKLL